MNIAYITIIQNLYFNNTFHIDLLYVNTRFWASRRQKIATFCLVKNLGQIEDKMEIFQLQNPFGNTMFVFLVTF